LDGPEMTGTLRLALVALIVLGAAFVAAMAADSPAESDSTQRSQDNEASLSVETAEVKREQVSETVTAFGTVAADPNSQFVVVSPIDGIVRRLNAYAGQVVSAGEVVADIEPAPGTRAQFAQLQSAVTNAEQQLEHTRRLFAQQLGTKDQVATAEKALTDARAQLEVQKALGAGEDKVVLRAPKTGIVTNLTAQIGAEVAAKAPIAEFADRTSLMIQLGIEPSDASEINPGDKVQLEHLFADGPKVPAEIASVGAVVEPTTRLLDALLRVTGDAAKQFALGETVKATVAKKQAEVLTIPRVAVLYDGDQAYVFVIEDGHARRQDVTLAQVEGESVWVEGGLKAALQVAISNLIGLKDGAAVSATSP
jgi:membrane fusion protein (multidrug efflux system)